MRRLLAVGALVAALVAAGVTAATRTGGDDRARAKTARGPELVDVLAGTGARPSDVAVGFAAGAGRVVTVAHVLGRGRPVRVRAAREPPSVATVAGADTRLDVAILATGAARRAREVRMARAEGGERARLLVRRAGRTVALPVVVRRRATLRLAGPEGGPPARRAGLVLAARVRPGDSGAPLVDDAGRVTGIVFARSRGREGIAYALEAAGLAGLLRAAVTPPPR